MIDVRFPYFYLMSKSSHILNASSNLLGFCLVVLTSIKVFGKPARTLIDEIDALAIILFITSCIFSFLSIRLDNERGEKYEKVADYIFLAGLVLLFVMTLLFVVESFS